jgi:hypothetical protein
MIIGPFSICGSREDLENLEREIHSCLADGRFIYGWVEIKEGESLSLGANVGVRMWER